MNPKSQCPGPGAQRWWRYASFCAIVALAVLVVLPGASFAGGTDPSRAEWQKRQSEVDGCALLNNPKIAGMMDGLLFYLAKQCNRFDLIGGVKGGGGAESDAVEAADSPVSNPALDGGTGSRTQSETSISRNPTTGTLCAAWNDSFHGVQQGLGFSGFGRSTDNGVTWTDKLNVSTTDSGDPSLIWRKVDGKFYYIALNAGGLAIWRSDDDCNSFVFVSQIVTGNDDKEIATVDNNPASAFYGRIYVAWTDFGAGNRIHVVTSSNAGATWTAQVPISATGEAVQGAWPAVAPSGDVFVAWHHWLSPGFPTGNTEIQVARSTDGGATFNLVTPPVSNVTSARDTTATSSCGRPALKGNVRYLPSPTIAVGPNGHLHAVYSYDPDATGSGDVVNVYYRRSTDNGATWQPEIQVNDDGGTNDQYQPSLS
nr:sialidase family protein [Thermoanaerobaculia bacterium]